jgi:hypothetical protein
MAAETDVYRRMCELAADAERRGLVRPVCEPGEVMIYDDCGNVVGKGRLDGERLIVPDHLAADPPTVIDAAGD